MKVNICVCATNLHDSRANFASLLLGDEEIGRTEVIEDSAIPIWNKIITLDCNDFNDANISVIVFADYGQTELGKVEFNVAAILERSSKVVSEDLGEGGTVFVHASDRPVDGKLKFQFYGKDLMNLSRMQFFGSKSNPYFELRSAHSPRRIVYTSEARRRDLNPTWSEFEVDLQSLFDDNFGSPIKFAVYDKDPGETKFMGSFECTVSELLAAQACGESVLLTKYGVKMGDIQVKQAEFVGFVHPKEILKAAVSFRDTAVESTSAADAKSVAAGVALMRAEAARMAAEARRRSERIAAGELTEARHAALMAKTESQNAAEEAERIRMAGLMGTLKFQFVAKALENVDRMKFLRGKSDPFFVLQKATVKWGKIDWSHGFISSVVSDDLNPEWEEVEVEVSSLCNGNLDDTIRVVVFDHVPSGKHILIGHFETSINGILNAQGTGEAFAVMRDDDGKTRGEVSVPCAELIDLLDPQAAEEKAKKLAREAETARFFAIGREHRANVALRRVEEAEEEAQELEQEAEAAAKAAELARRAALERTVTTRLRDLGLHSSVVMLKQ